MGGKRLISSVIHKCVTCGKLRGKMQAQKMVDLPADRVTPEPPFTTVGLDVFRPWTIIPLVQEVVVPRANAGLSSSCACLPGL